MTVSFLLFMWMIIYPLGSAAHSQASSLFTQEIFLNIAEDPFMDSYIERISLMDRAALMKIPQLDDEQFLLELAQNINKTDRISTRNVNTSVFNQLLDDQLVLQDTIDNEWEELMVSAPMVLNYLGNIMVLASKRDFPFVAPPNYVFRYIRYPNSFRATLAQVSSDMYNALMGAHTAMDRVQLAIQQVPIHVKTTLKLLTAASPNMLKTLLPRSLETISHLANESATTASVTLRKFELLQELLSEIIELSATTQSTHELTIMEIERKKNEFNAAQGDLAMTVEKIKEHYQSSRLALEEARKEYNKAMKSLQENIIPTRSANENSFSTKIIDKIIDTVFAVILEPLKKIICIFAGCDEPRPVDNTKFENAKKSAELARDRLKEAEQRYDLHFQQQLAAQNELAQTLRAMSMLDISKLDTEEIISLLLEATKEIHLIKEQWARLIRFFSKLSAQADNAQQVIARDLIQNINDAQEKGLLLDPIDREFFVAEILVPVTMEINRGAHVIYTMATTYYEVSSKYMIDQIAGIGKLLLLTNDGDRQTQLQAVSNSSAITSAKISRLVQERRTIYLENTHARQKQYDQYIADLMALQTKKAIIN